MFNFYCVFCLCVVLGVCIQWVRVCVRFSETMKVKSERERRSVTVCVRKDRTEREGLGVCMCANVCV
jgi:hypothetical protein